MKLSPLASGRGIGRTNVRDVAERQKSEIEVFLASLFKMSDEVSHVCLIFAYDYGICLTMLTKVFHL